MAKAYYFNYIPVSDTSQCSTDEAAHICDQMIQIVIAAFKEYGLYVKDNNYFSCRQGKKLLADEKCFCCVYPDKLGAAWDHSTWDYNRDKSGEIFVVFKKDNKIVVSFGTNKIAKENTNEEIISRIRDRAVASGILTEESMIYETEERTVEKPNSNNIEKYNTRRKIVIQKYAKAELYGYGFIVEYGCSPIEYEYTKAVTIQHRGSNENGIKFDMGMKPITLKKKNFSGNLQDVKQPIYLVEDDGVWKEYFSGTEVKHLPLYASNRYNLLGEYQLLGGTYYVGDKFKGIREFVFGDKGWEHPRFMEAQDFANEISRYSDAEIKSMVGQFLKLKENAATWGAKFDQAVEEFTKGHDSQNEMASNKLADGMGKYASVQPGFSDEIILDQNPMQSSNKDSNKEKKNGNRAIIVLVIALIIVSFLWIIK